MKDIVIMFYVVQIFLWVYKSQLVLSPTSGSFPMWQDLPAPLIARIFIFNVTNPDQVGTIRETLVLWAAYRL